MSIVDEWRKEIDNFFKGMTRENFIKHLQEAGFTVEDGTGRVIDEDGNDITDEILKD